MARRADERKVAEWRGRFERFRRGGLSVARFCAVERVSLPSLFLGSVAAGERAANFLTLVSSTLRNDLDVYIYLKAVLDALLAGCTDYATLRPDHWAATHPEAIRTYRQEERRDRYNRKSAHRAERRPAATDSS